MLFRSMFGNPETTTGGRALKFYSSVRLDVRKVESLKQGGEVIGNRTRVKVVKNKVAPPFKEAEFDIMFGKGISREGDILDLAAEQNVIVKSGAWYAYEGNKIGQGRENAKQYLRDNPEAWKAVEEKVREHYGFGKKADKVTETEVKSNFKTDAKKSGGRSKAGSKAEAKAASVPDDEVIPVLEETVENTSNAAENTEQA